MLKGTLTNKVIEVNELESYADKLGYCLISKKEVKDEI